MTKMMWRVPLLLAAAGALGACSSVAPRQMPPVAVVSTVEPAMETARLAVLDIQRDWSFQGRVAISKGREGGNGRIEWQQQGDAYRVSLSAPVTRQSWTLTGGEGRQARLDGLQGGPRSGDDVDQLLLQATGWVIPVAQLHSWVRGQAAPEGPAADYLGYDAQGRPRLLRQQGWQIDYLDWYPDQEGLPALPRHIEAVSGDAKVRLIVDSWGADGK